MVLPQICLKCLKDKTDKEAGNDIVFREWDIYRTYGTCDQTQTGNKQDKQDIALPVNKSDMDRSNGYRGIMGTFLIIEAVEEIATTPEPIQLPTQSGEPVRRLLALLQKDELSCSQLREALNVKHRPTSRQNYLHPALSADFIEYTTIYGKKYRQGE